MIDVLLQTLFDTLILGAALEGGDGWSILLSDKWKMYANEFAKYTENHKNYIKNDYDDCMVFSDKYDREESITFADKSFVFDKRFYEMIIYY